MEVAFEINLTNRNVLLKFLENYTLEQINKIPTGFSNNLIWNIGHVVVVQQMLVYKLSGLPMMISDEMVDKYKKGSKPDGNVSQLEVDEVKKLLFSTLEQTKKDFDKAIFHNYMEFNTMTNFTIKNAKAAVEFNNYHEGIHLGIILQIKKYI